jgi:hypothetical protein
MEITLYLHKCTVSAHFIWSGFLKDAVKADDYLQGMGVSLENTFFRQDGA